MVINSGTWDDEIALWTPDIDATQVPYSSIAQRAERGRVPRDQNGFPMTPLKPEYRRRWGTVILDECHYIKGRKTSWANAVLELNALNVMQDTGTPIPNWAQEAFMPLRSMWPERARAGHELGSYWRWVGEWFDINEKIFKRGAAPSREVGDLREDRTWDEFREANWGDRFLRRLRDDVLKDLPPLAVQKWKVPMAGEQLKVYKRLKKDFVAWLDSGAEVAAWTEPGLLVKLAKLSTGIEVLDPTYTGNPTGKIKALGEILWGRDRQTLVVAHFRDTIEACARASTAVGKKSAIIHGGVSKDSVVGAIRAFQQGRIDTLCASITMIAEGMTLHQGGADMVIRVERTATPSKNDQVVRRLHRIGQTRPVFVVDLETPGSYDSKQTKMLEGKTDQQVKALGDDLLRELIL
jgi:SNF2 family DNA or RNA helicase